MEIYMIKNIKNMVDVFINVFKLLWKSSRFYFIGMLIVNIFSGLTLSLNMIIWKNIINTIQKTFETGSTKLALYWLIGFMFLEFFQNIMDEANQYFKNILASCTNKYITKAILEKTKEISMTHYAEASMHDKIKKASEESVGRTMNLLYSTGLLIKGISVFISTAIILVRFNPPTMIICLVTSIPMLLISMKIAIKQFAIYNERFENIRFIEYIKALLTKHENVKEIKIYGVTDFFIEYIDKLYKRYIHEDKKIRKKFSFNSMGAKFAENIVVYIIKAMVCIKVIILKISIGDLTLYISAIDNFKSAIANILSVITTIYEDGLYVNNFFELISLEEEKSSKRELFFNGKFERIIFSNVWFKYPGASDYILKGVNLEIESGNTYAIVGLNGSGKTTILKLLLRLYLPNKGHIYIDNKDIADMNIESYYKYIAAVFQDFIKYPLSFKQNIGLGDVERMDIEEEIIDAAEKSGIYDYINSLPAGIDTKLQMEWTNATELSLGQWQKLAISRAFFKKAQILILDEPTASLDPVAESDISSKIRELIGGKTCILIAHRFSTVKLVNRIYVLKAGAIEESGSHSELMLKGGEYSKLYSMQAQGYID